MFADCYPANCLLAVSYVAMSRVIRIVFALSLLATTAAAQSTTEDGVRAMLQGDYRDAFRILRPLADDTAHRTLRPNSSWRSSATLDIPATTNASARFFCVPPSVPVILPHRRQP